MQAGPSPIPHRPTTSRRLEAMRCSSCEPRQMEIGFIEPPAPHPDLATARSSPGRSVASRVARSESSTILPSCGEPQPGSAQRRGRSPRRVTLDGEVARATVYLRAHSSKALVLRASPASPGRAPFLLTPETCPIGDDSESRRLPLDGSRPTAHRGSPGSVTRAPRQHSTAGTLMSDPP
jgi:hypothetical protein